MKVVFLDIDGVLQPYNSRKRFDIDRKKLVDYLSDKYKIDYHKYDPYDIAACYKDWDKLAVLRIKKILLETKSKIVVSSDWRSKYLTLEPKDKMLDLLRIWNMDNFYYDETESAFPVGFKKDNTISWDKIREEVNNLIIKKENGYYHDTRADEIYYYLKTHNEIDNYVVIDDKNLPEFNSHFIRTNNVINDEQTNRAINILNDDNLKLVRKID